MTDETAKSEEFWRYKPLSAMTDAEWESLCDGCGRCCMHKLEDEDSGKFFLTAIACRLLDAVTCRCSNYNERQNLVPDCLKLTLAMVQTVKWLPPTCAYRRLNEGRGLAPWHPLISGNRQSVHDAGISMRGKIAKYEDELTSQEEYLNYILS